MLVFDIALEHSLNGEYRRNAFPPIFNLVGFCDNTLARNYVVDARKQILSALFWTLNVDIGFYPSKGDGLVRYL